MDMSELPPFWLAYLSDPSDSGRIHSNIRQRWLSGMSPNQTLLFWRQEVSNGADVTGAQQMNPTDGDDLAVSCYAGAL